MKHIKTLIVIDTNNGIEYREVYERPSKDEIRTMCKAHDISFEKVMAALGRLPINEEHDWVTLIADSYIDAIGDELNNDEH